MFNKTKAVSSETPSFPPPPPNHNGVRRLGKKLYVIVAVVAIVIIAAAFFTIPQSEAAIPLNVDYVLGEKMVYDTTLTVNYDFGSSLGSLTLNSPNSTTIDAQQTIEVTGFDGENYLLNHTMTMNVLNQPVSVSIIEKMN